MALKTPEHYEQNWDRNRIAALVIAVRAEFAAEAEARLRLCVCDPMFSERERLTFGLATAIVEALAREFGGPP